jgi:hypothetical protein
VQRCYKHFVSRERTIGTSFFIVLLTRGDAAVYGSALCGRVLVVCDLEFRTDSNGTSRHLKLLAIFKPGSPKGGWRHDDRFLIFLTFIFTITGGEEQATGRGIRIF